jgi:TetR/AcrR family transcriptional regulator
VEIEMKAKSGSGAPPREAERSGGGVLSPTERDRILQAMTECCAERGYPETSVAEVIERAEVSRERFEALFADKEECAVAAINRIASEVLTTVSTIDPGKGSELKQGLAAVRAILELMASRPSYAALAYIGARQGGTARMQDAYEGAARVLSVMIERFGREMSGASALPSRASRAALGGAEALVRREIAAGRAERLAALMPDLLYSVLVPFSGPREAMRLVEAIAAEGG